MRDESAVRVFVLNYLRNGPSDLKRMFAEAWRLERFTRYEVAGACERLGVLCTEGNPFLAKLPDNLAAIWWARRAPAAQHNYGDAA